MMHNPLGTLGMTKRASGVFFFSFLPARSRLLLKRTFPLSLEELAYIYFLVSSMVLDKIIKRPPSPENEVVIQAPRIPRADRSINTPHVKSICKSAKQSLDYPRNLRQTSAS